MITRESIINAVEKDFVELFCGESCVRLQPKLCENLYYMYEMCDGHLYCSELTGEGTIRYRADEMDGGHLYSFLHLLFTVIERKARKAGQYAIARKTRKICDELYQVLTK